VLKKKLLVLFLLIITAGCSRADSSILPAASAAGRTALNAGGVASMMTLLRSSGMPLASLRVAANGSLSLAARTRRDELPANTAARQVSQVDETADNPALGIISISGHVINASGSIPPQNSFIGLTIYEEEGIVSQIKIPLDRSGVFRFDLIPWNPAFSYQVSTTFNDIAFTSALIDGRLLQPGMEVNIPILVYNSSTNTEFLRALRMKVIYDFSTPGWVHVSENIIITNPTSLVIVAPGDNVPVLNYMLPKGAVNITFPDGNPSRRYRLTQDGFGDWEPVMPGNGHQVMVQYSLPFTSTWRCDLNTPIPLDSLMVVIKASGIETVSSGMQLNLIKNDPATALAVYVASGIRSEGSYSLTFTTRDHIQRVWLGILFFVASLTFALLWVIRSNRQREKARLQQPVAENQENEDTILDAIIALDDRYRHGDLSAEAYARTRWELVEKLEAMRKQNKT